MTEECRRTCSRAITKPSGRTPCSHGLNPELFTGSPNSKHGVNYQFQMSNDYQREVKNKPACLIRLTSTSLNLHTNSQLSVHTFKIKAIVWLALQIILISSELEGNVEVIISNPIILQIRKLNKVKTDKVAYPSSQSHFRMKKMVFIMILDIIPCCLQSEKEKDHRGWRQALLELHRGRKDGQSWPSQP